MARPRRMKYKTEFEAAQAEYLITGVMTTDKDFEWDALMFKREKDNQLSFWKVHKEKILKDFIFKYPSQRPWAWWKFDAPEMRKRLGGIGTPRHEVLGVTESFNFGIPVDYVTQFESDYYNGRLITCQWKSGDFKGTPVDPDNPPIYETQLTYLKRLGFLTKEEKRLLKLQNCK